MRRFDSDYLRRTRRGMWTDRGALEPARLHEASSVLDVGCGNGEFTRVLADECGGKVVGCDADTEHLRDVRDTLGVPVVAGDAYALPFVDSSFDVVACQALLVNLREPLHAVDEMARVAAERVVCVEPDNSAVSVESSVEDEAELARRSRRRYLAGASTNPALGKETADLLRDAGLGDVTVTKHEQQLVVEPPYDESDVKAVRRKASGESFRGRRDDMEGDDDTLDDLRDEWREIGREAALQVSQGRYVRRETVPFYVVVGEK
ncbi:MAG: methyltransferase domain-containing protein [Halobacteriales archaeon]